MSSKKIGFIGLGNMGQPMSARLLAAGYHLTVYDVVASKVSEMEKQGAHGAGSPAGVAAGADIIITMISNGRVLKEIVTGSNGLLGSARPGAVLIDMSTIDPESSNDVAGAVRAKGLAMLCAPVSGSTTLAESGQLTIFVSGDKQVFDSSQAVLKNLGQKIYHVGEKAEARYIKLALNIMVGTTLQMLAEALVFGEKAGISPAKLLDLIMNSVVASPLIGYKAGPLSKKDYTAAFTVDNMAKDFELALSAGGKLKTPMPVAALVHDFLGRLQATGRGNLDFSALVQLVEERAGAR